MNLTSNSLFHPTCEHGCKNRAVGGEERTERTEIRLFTDEEHDVRHFPVDGSIPELFVTCLVYWFVYEVGYHAAQVNGESEDGNIIGWIG